eukprot:scaffold62190_cov59-Phaeocystis_antarctica.AAC.1
MPRRVGAALGVLDAQVEVLALGEALTGRGEVRVLMHVNGPDLAGRVGQLQSPLRGAPGEGEG